MYIWERGDRPRRQHGSWRTPLWVSFSNSIQRQWAMGLLEFGSGTWHLKILKTCRDHPEVWWMLWGKIQQKSGCVWTSVKDIQAARLLHYDCMRFNKWCAPLSCWVAGIGRWLSDEVERKETSSEKEQMQQSCILNPRRVEHLGFAEPFLVSPSNFFEAWQRPIIAFLSGLNMFKPIWHGLDDQGTIEREET